MYILGMVMFGCLNTETTKMQFTMESRGIDGQLKPFHKPWQAVFTMFLAMDVVLIYHWLASRRTKTLVDTDAFASGQALLGTEEEQLTGCRRFLTVGWPALFDLLGTGFGMVGFVFLPASINQMLRGSTIVFSAFMAVMFLKRRMVSYNWLGIALCVMGIALVGVSNVLQASARAAVAEAAVPAGGASMVVFGMCMNLLGQVFASGQIVMEEKMLKDMKMPAMQVVGYEGVWGTILMICVVFPLNYLLPGSDNGSNENAYDTWLMLCNNHTLVLLICMYICSCSTYNIAGMLVTSSLSAVHRTMLEASRTLVIWAINLFVHYFIDASSGLGEAWTPYSYIQLAGFAVVILGQLVYGGLLRVPCLRYDVAKLPVLLQSPGASQSMMMLPSVQDGAVQLYSDDVDKAYDDIDKL